MRKNTIKIVCISDTHSKTEDLNLPPGDILIHAGDMTKSGFPSEVQSFNTFLSKQPFKYKIVIAGNHDLTFDSLNYPLILEKKHKKNKPNFNFETQNDPDCFNIHKFLTEAIYLEDSGCEIEGFSFYGSPWSPEKSVTAFKLARGEQILEKWKKIPEKIDVLITHTPPFGILDKTKHGVKAGCEDLLRELERIKPKVHVFGHIHDGYGILENKGVKFINATSWCNGRKNEPICFELERKNL